MCRIESQALRNTESKGASERLLHSENRLIAAMERFANHTINRRRKSVGLPEKDTPLVLTPEQRERVRSNVQKLAEAAR